MLKILSEHLTKKAQTFLDEIKDPEWADDYEDETSVYGEPGVIDESNYIDFLADEEKREEQVPPQEPVLPPEVTRDIPQIEYKNARRLVYDGIDNIEVIEFDYTNRHGMYAGTRIVEPHYTFVARTTGNEVLVSYDKSVGDIRAFILGNIHPFGIRYKGIEFEPREDIMRGVY